MSDAPATADRLTRSCRREMADADMRYEGLEHGDLRQRVDGLRGSWFGDAAWKGVVLRGEEKAVAWQAGGMSVGIWSDGVGQQRGE